ncbi:MAG: outer membrane beta-barrel protein [Acidobacteriota bacterium]|nr:outer membrane beta-barrel protein [Acidobacteriota bacterium]
MIHRYVTCGLLALMLLLGATDAAAQVWVGRSGPRAGAVEISGGGTWSAGQDLGERAATLTPNPGAGSSFFDLFQTEQRLKPVFGGQAIVGYYITRAFAIEGGIQYSRPTLSVTLSDDFEEAPSLTATTAITQYLFTGSVVYHFGTSPSAVPFIAVGAGHLRDVHNGNELLETGIEYHGNVGVKWWTGSGRGRIGVRAEGGLSMRTGVFDFDDERRVVPTVAVSLAYLF